MRFIQCLFILTLCHSRDALRPIGPYYGNRNELRDDGDLVSKLEVQMIFYEGWASISVYFNRMSMSCSMVGVEQSTLKGHYRLNLRVCDSTIQTWFQSTLPSLRLSRMDGSLHSITPLPITLFPQTAPLSGIPSRGGHAPFINPLLARPEYLDYSLVPHPPLTVHPKINLSNSVFSGSDMAVSFPTEFVARWHSRTVCSDIPYTVSMDYVSLKTSECMRISGIVGSYILLQIAAADQLVWRTTVDGMPKTIVLSRPSQ
jgi:hypothetical protein